MTRLGMRFRRRHWWWLALGLAAAGWLAAWLTYPSDRTADGAYLRVMSAVNRDSGAELFPYLETRAQHACFTIGDYRDKTREVIESAYPEKLRAAELRRLGAAAIATDGPDVFDHYARRFGWLGQLRKDMSGVERVEVAGERATVETARGTRYPFRRRDNGMWGLTLYTAVLDQEATRAARDFALVQSAAEDFQRAAPLGSAAAQ